MKTGLPVAAWILPATSTYEPVFTVIYFAGNGVGNAYWISFCQNMYAIPENIAASQAAISTYFMFVLFCYKISSMRICHDAFFQVKQPHWSRGKNV